MKKMKIFAWTILLAAGLTACTDWLTVQPKTEVSKDDMFKSSGGFRDALIGVYTLMRENNYAPNGNLVTGMVEFIANLWYTESNSESGDFAAHNYRGDAVERANGELFLQQYKTITNLNQMLAYMENGVLSSREYALYKGEALGLRAYLHFDLIRLYGPMPMNVQEGRRYLPYETTISLGNYTYSTYNEYMGALIADLDSAEILLARVDPIITTSNSVLNTTNEYRQNRMNYYAVSGILARAYLYNNQPNEAYKIAKEIIDSQNNTKYYNFTSASKMTKGNLKFYDDILCGFYSTKLTDWDKALNDVLDADGNQLFMEVKEVDNLFNGETDDYRKRYQLSAVNRLMKYAYQNNATSEGILSSNLIPIIRMSEIYYIAAEACFDKDPSEAIDYLMQVKKGRNLRNVDLSGITLKSDFMDRLISDARREFLGEGQIFFMFKRLNQSVPTVNNWKSENFVLDVPDSENI